MHNKNAIQVFSPDQTAEDYCIKDYNDAVRTISDLLVELGNSHYFPQMNSGQVSRRDFTWENVEAKSNGQNVVPVSERHLLNFREAAMLLSMSEASLRDLVHKGQGPENVRRGKRVCFTNEGLQRYVDGLPREYPYQGVIETINAKGSRPASIEEQRAFGA